MQADRKGFSCSPECDSTKVRRAAWQRLLCWPGAFPWGKGCAFGAQGQLQFMA